MEFAIGCDHGGFETKEALKNYLIQQDIKVKDLGGFDKSAVDYPDYAAAVARKVSDGEVDFGIVICTTGIGVSIVANKFPRVRAALCTNPDMAKMARAHNHANVLALGGSTTDEETAKNILKQWLETPADKSSRHVRRVKKIYSYSIGPADPIDVYETDPEIYTVIRNEEKRQAENLQLIASENYTSRSVREVTGSVLTNKYAEGYPSKRWYQGCEQIDEVERLAIDRAKELFGDVHINVQPHCGSSANLAVYLSVLNPGDRILAMSPEHGGHLSHGLPANISGHFFKIMHYGVNKNTEQLDYDEINEIAEQFKPKLIIAGASAYSRMIDFKKFQKIAKNVSAYLMADIAHIAGLVAAGFHPSPVGKADFITSTTHKTLRGPRGGLIMCDKRFAQDIDKQIFPGLQGGPLMHVIAGKAVCFQEALQPSFKKYQEQTIKNTQVICEELKNSGLKIVADGSDNHLLLVDLTPLGLTGKEVAASLENAAITVNKNKIPFDKKSAAITSGIRIGTPAVTTRGMKEKEMKLISSWIIRVLEHPKNTKIINTLNKEVHDFVKQYPIP
jgi:glycine hydroxymethyltransferase